MVNGGRESSTVCTSTFKDLLPTAYCHAAKRSRFVLGVESSCSLVEVTSTMGRLTAN